MIFLIGVFIYLNEYELTAENRIEVGSSEFYSDEVGPERVALLEEGEIALSARLSI